MKSGYNGPVRVTKPWKQSVTRWEAEKIAAGTFRMHRMSELELKEIQDSLPETAELLRRARTNSW